MIYQYCFGVLFLSSIVHGQISLAVPAAGYCGNTTKLTCTVTGAVATAHTWTGPPSGGDIVINGVEVVVRNKYSEEVSGNQFSLIISDTSVATDQGDYTCTNNFDISAPQTLKCQCVEGVTVSPDGSSMKIEVSEAYPNTVDVKSVSLSKDGQTHSSTINVTRVSLEQNGEYFHFVWKSDSIVYGTYTYTVTIKAETDFVFSGKIEFETPVPPGPGCCCICCFIPLIVNVVLIVLLVLVHIILTWTNNDYSIKKICYRNKKTTNNEAMTNETMINERNTDEAVCLKDYGLKAVLPGCCICLMVIIIQFAVYFGALKQEDCGEDCDKCCGIVICLVVPIVVSIVKDAIGLIIIYIFVLVKGCNYTDQGQSPATATELSANIRSE